MSTSEIEELAAEKAEYHGDIHLGDNDGRRGDLEGEDIDHQVCIQLIETAVELQSKEYKIEWIMHIE